MAKSLAGGKIRFRQKRADGSSRELEVDVREGDVITIEREYPSGQKEERQIFPQVTGNAPVKSPWKGENER